MKKWLLGEGSAKELGLDLEEEGQADDDAYAADGRWRRRRRRVRQVGDRAGGGEGGDGVTRVGGR